jgi:predicted lysophospholipase L1 biosynthesis ABC-type transport system permease subunit
MAADMFGDVAMREILADTSALLPALFAVPVVVLLFGLRKEVSPIRFKVAAAIVAVCATASLMIALGYTPLPPFNRLVRDVVAAVVLATIAPSAAAAVAAKMTRVQPLWRVSIGLGVGLLSIGLSPFILLLVHCTSGDCL